MFAPEALRRSAGTSERQGNRDLPLLLVREDTAELDDRSDLKVPDRCNQAEEQSAAQRRRMARHGGAGLRENPAAIAAHVPGDRLSANPRGKPGESAVPRRRG